jgi:hypothetical protein
MIEAPKIGRIAVLSAVLFTQPDPYMGPAETNLLCVRGLTEIVVTVDGMEWHYHGPLAATARRAPGGKTEILLFRRDNDMPLNLAAVPGAVAAAVIDSGGGWLFRFDNGRCIQHERCENMGGARCDMQERCRPQDGYELPLASTEVDLSAA